MKEYRFNFTVQVADRVTSARYLGQITEDLVTILQDGVSTGNLSIVIYHLAFFLGGAVTGGYIAEISGKGADVHRHNLT